jgi:hypothetical protein
MEYFVAILGALTPENNTGKNERWALAATSSVVKRVTGQGPTSAFFRFAMGIGAVRQPGFLAAWKQNCTSHFIASWRTDSTRSDVKPETLNP